MRLRLFISLCLFMGLQLNAQEVYKQIVARNTGVKVLADGVQIRVMGFATTLGQQPGVPGPTLVFNEGDSVHIELYNLSQGAPHTIHLHGLDVDQANDGVPHLSFVVGHQERGSYLFVAPHAGTYLYHCHVVSTIHVQAGMYGLIIIKPEDGSNTAWKNGPAFNKEFSFLTSEIDTNWHTESVLLHDHDDTATMQIPVPKFNPQYFLVNGLSDQQLVDDKVVIELKTGKTGLIRLANIGFLANTIKFPSEMNATIIASDGRPLTTTEATNSLTVLPGERYDVLLKPIAEYEGLMQFEYINMNNGAVLGTQNVAIAVTKNVGVEALQGEFPKVHIYPNPTTNVAHIVVDPDAGRVVRIECFDVLGRITSKHHFDKDTSINEFSINLEGHVGINHIRVSYADGTASAHRVLVH